MAKNGPDCAQLVSNSAEQRQGGHQQRHPIAQGGQRKARGQADDGRGAVEGPRGGGHREQHLQRHGQGTDEDRGRGVWQLGLRGCEKKSLWGNGCAPGPLGQGGPCEAVPIRPLRPREREAGVVAVQRHAHGRGIVQRRIGGP